MSPHPCLIIAIDGGAASGKSSTSRALSERFNLLHADTGSFYRALTAELLRLGARPGDLPAVHAALSTIKPGIRVTGRRAEMEINGRVPGGEIRSREVNENVSHFAAIPELRALLLDYQRSHAAVAARHGFRGLVMEGRDIGSVIFPDAPLRFYLEADPAERARRRAAEGGDDQVRERDRLDSQRRTAPLVRADGAISIDTTLMTLPEVIELLSGHVRNRLEAVEDPGGPHPSPG